MTSVTSQSISIFFFFNDTATTEIYTLSLHDALPISSSERIVSLNTDDELDDYTYRVAGCVIVKRSGEHTSELQSLAYLVCRLLLLKKKKNNNHTVEDHYN